MLAEHRQRLRALLQEDLQFVNQYSDRSPTQPNLLPANFYCDARYTGDGSSGAAAAMRPERAKSPLEKKAYAVGQQLRELAGGLY